jgi:hypothetical protein
MIRLVPVVTSMFKDPYDISFPIKNYISGPVHNMISI